MQLYQNAGVFEYISVLVREQRVVWRRLISGSFAVHQPDQDGITRSLVSPGLWLDPAALLRGDTPRLLEILQHGIHSPEHATFVERLASQRQNR